jgi:hypothetical protein
MKEVKSLVKEIYNKSYWQRIVNTYTPELHLPLKSFTLFKY